MAQGGSGYPPPRSDTPPRTGSAPIRLLRICLDERVLGGVEVNESSTLTDVRASVEEDEIQGVPPNYVFLFGGAPVSRRQEGRRRAVNCFPFLVIIPEDARVPAAGQGIEGTSEVPSGATPTASSQVLEVTAAQRLVPSSPGGVAGQQPPAEPTSPAGDVTRLEEHDGGLLPGAGAGPALELQITDGPLEGTTITTGEEGVRIGRHTSNAMVIPEAGISRYHCEICLINGDFCIRDLGSTTGTYFYLRPHGHFQMFAGLMIKLGETEFQVLSQTAPAAEEPEQVVLFYEGPLAGHKLHITAEGITIGRRHNNNLVLMQDGTVSARHAMVFCEDGEFFISDLGSCNGTCIRLSAERTDSDWHPIMDGDVLGAGCTKVRCQVHRG